MGSSTVKPGGVLEEVRLWLGQLVGTLQAQAAGLHRALLASAGNPVITPAALPIPDTRIVARWPPDS